MLLLEAINVTKLLVGFSWNSSVVIANMVYFLTDVNALPLQAKGLSRDKLN